MKSLLSLFATSAFLFSLVYATELRCFVDNTDIGNIRGSITDLRILNAFVRANPRLPAELRVTNNRDRIIYVPDTYTNRAIIGIRTGPSGYTGYVQVTFNGGPPAAEASSSDSDCDAAGGSNWSSRFNLSAMTNLDRNLGTITDNTERSILQSFLFQNQHLPSDLMQVLSVRRRTHSSATLYVPEGNSRYIGEVTVYYSIHANRLPHDELV